MDPRLYDRFADAFVAARSGPWPQAARFVESLPADARCLDVGCAHGRHMRRADVGVDPSRGLLLRNARRDGGRLAQGLLPVLPFRDGAFDAALCVAVVHHLLAADDRLRAVREVLRVARAGAPVLLSCWRHDQPRFEAGPADVEVDFTDRDGTKHARAYHLFGPGELEGLLGDAGARRVEEWAVEGNRWARAEAP